MVDPALVLSNLGTAALTATGTGAVAYRKARVEGEGISVKTLREVAGELRIELERREQQLRELRAELTLKEQELNTLHGHLAALSLRLDQLPTESK